MPVDHSSHPDKVCYNQFVMLKLIDFHAEWCPPCKLMAPIIAELEKEYAEKVIFEKVDVDHNSDRSSHYGVLSIPTFVLEKDGQEIERLIGARPKEEFVSLFQKHQTI